MKIQKGRLINMKAEIWAFGRGQIKVFTSDYAIKVQIARWAEARVSCWYLLPDGTRAWDLILPSKLHDRAATLLGLPMKQKSRKRVEGGKRVGIHNFRYVLAEVKNYQKPPESGNVAESSEATVRFI